MKAIFYVSLIVFLVFGSPAFLHGCEEGLQFNQTIIPGEKSESGIPGLGTTTDPAWFWNAAGSPSEGFTYTVQSGDWLSKIAARYLGDPHRYWEIVEANKGRYPSIAKNPDLIYPGWQLVIPGASSSRPSVASPSAGSSEGTVSVSTTLNIRTGPWGRIVGSFHNGDKVQITGRTGDWYKISHNGTTAYVHANYISTAGRPTGRVPVTRPSAPSAAWVAAPPVTAGSGRFGGSPSTPAAARVSSPFGWRTHPIRGGRSFHKGVDLPMPNGTRLNALGDGVVTAVGYDNTSGHFIKVRYDNGYESFYCHLQRATARRGQRVNQGEQIALSNNTGGSTGPHLHFELRRNGQAIDPARVSSIRLTR